METLPRLALWKGRASRHELLGSNLVVAGLERPVHQKGHFKARSLETFPQIRRLFCESKHGGIEQGKAIPQYS